MGKIGEFFEFSRRQLIALAILTSGSLLASGYLFVKTFTTPARVSKSLPVFLGDKDSRLLGFFILDPNSSPADSLELLPGIGRVLADRIVAYRQDHVFKKEVDITDVKGIGPKVFERIRPYLRIQRQ